MGKLVKLTIAPKICQTGRDLIFNTHFWAETATTKAERRRVRNMAEKKERLEMLEKQRYEQRKFGNMDLPL